jgi:hypothetical protein
MQLRKYTKVFKNRKSAKKLEDAMQEYAFRKEFPEDKYPRLDITFDHNDRKRIGRFTVTYYKGTYISKINYRQDDIYGKNAKDAIAKFKKAIKEGIAGYTPIVKGAKLKSDSGGMKLYTITHYLKKNK